MAESIMASQHALAVRDRASAIAVALAATIVTSRINAVRTIAIRNLHAVEQ